MYVKPLKEEIREAMQWGWKRKEAERGWIVSCSHTKYGLLDCIERIDDIYYNTDVTDEDCAKEAAKHGYPIIPIEDLPTDFPLKAYVFLDNPHNREVLSNYN